MDQSPVISCITHVHEGKNCITKFRGKFSLDCSITVSETFLAEIFNTESKIPAKKRTHLTSLFNHEINFGFQQRKGMLMASLKH